MENTVDDMENPSNEEDINKKDVETKTRDFINSVVELAKTEANQTKEELSVLEQMNNVAASEYAQIADTITSISSFKDDLHKKHEMLAKHIVEIDKIDKTPFAKIRLAKAFLLQKHNLRLKKDKTCKNNTR